MGENGFKETPLGMLPEGWEIVRIGEIVEKMRSGGTPKRGETTYWDGNIPFVLIEDMTSCDFYLSSTKRHITERGLQNSSAWVVPPGSLLLSMYATIGATAINTIPVATNQAILAIIPKPGFDVEFGAYLLKYHAKRLSSLNVQSTQKNVNKGIVEAFPIPLPPLPEQRSIAHVLSSVRQAIEATQRVIDAAQQLKRSLMRHLFTYGPVSVEQAGLVRLKETEVGEVPEEWKIATVGDVFQIRLGKMLSGAARKGISPKPYIRNANVQWGYINIADVAKMDFLPEETEKFRLRADDILICEGGEIGRTAIWKNQLPECYYQKAIHRLRPKAQETDVLPDYFLYYMMLVFLVRHCPIVQGAKSTIAHLPVDKLTIMPLILPSIEEQIALVNKLKAIDSKIDAENQRKAALESLFQSLLHQLMTGKVRVHDTDVLTDTRMRIG